MRRSGVSIYNDPVLVDHYVMILCRHNANDNVILDHVNNPAVSQLCSFITTHVLFFSSPPLAVTFNVGNDSGETLLLYHFCLLASTGGCTRSTGTYSVAVTSVWHCYDLWCRAQCEYETFPTMLGWRIVLHLSFFVCMATRNRVKDEQTRAPWPKEFLHTQVMTKQCLAVIYCLCFVKTGLSSYNSLSSGMFLSLH